jgi:hypothetical protein
MLMYESELSKSTLTLMDQLFPAVVRQNILEVIQAGPTSQFHCKIQQTHHNLHVYLIEDNRMEEYTMCHFFSTDTFGDDYLYQSMPLEHVESLAQFASQVSLI